MTRAAVAVVIPARDEADGIARSLEHVLCALHLAQVTSPLVVVAADSCVDGTAAIARAALGARAIVVEGDWGCVGQAREAGTFAALAALGAGEGWLANTDADTLVPRTWIRHQLAHYAAGAAAVAGIVQVADFGEHPRGTARAFAQNYRVPAGGAHTHVHAANLGRSIAAYVDSGG